jgi:predicted phosphodiesterase
VFDFLAAASSMVYQSASVCFFGHTHIPMAVFSDGIMCGGSYTKFETKPGRKYFVNVGSVGQPRDGNPKAAYVIYDMDESSIELCALPSLAAVWQRSHFKNVC